MTPARFLRLRDLTGMSGRLLALTVCFVMLAEVLIYLPSISRFRREYFQEQIAKAHLAALALEASPDQMITDPLSMDLLLHAGAHAIVLRVPERRMLMLSDRLPPVVAATIDLRQGGMLEWIGDAIGTLAERGNRVLRVIGTSPRDPDATVEVLLDEAPLRRAMLAYSARIGTLSVVISLITASLLYLALQVWMVRPIVRLTESMVRFRGNPEDEVMAARPSRRTDELGLAQRELAMMQNQVRAALRQKTRLAAVGFAVAKIHHDLRNILATAVLASDQLAEIDDPKVQRVTPALYQAIDRAVALSSRTLEFLNAEAPPLKVQSFPLADLIAEVSAAVGSRDGSGLTIAADVDSDAGEISGDREQLFRVFTNLALNAAQAGATHLNIQSATQFGRVRIDISDDGPGIPAKVRESLFLPFISTSRRGGTGLGLVIAREIVAAHGGSLDLLATGPQGTSFRIFIPRRALRPQRG
ncbi:MAG: HAMP domain-containing histidine kinase [Rhodospirillales bacterium]|nr:HAMP domain-containing histidine kinase [Rhodospirillales bacterium]